MESHEREDSVDNLRRAAKRRLALRLAQKTVKSYRRVRGRLSSSSNVSGANSTEPKNVVEEKNAESRDADALEEYDEGPPEAAAAPNGNAADWPEDDQEKFQSNKRLAIDEEVQEELACMIGTDTDVRYYQRPSKDIVEAREIRDQGPKSKPQIDESRASDVIPLLSKPAKSAEEKLLVLEARDKLIRIQKNQVEGKQLKKKQSGNVGTCPDMCPEKERYERIARHQVDYYEYNRDTKEVIMAWMVKKYARSSADQQMPLQHDLRPGKVLWMTMSYLVNQFMDLVDEPGENLGEWYHFLWDRTRSVRKDIVQLELCDQESVFILEMCARFHIFCMERLREEKMAVFDEKINRENLTKCLQSLQYMYSDLRLNKNECCPNEPEFQAYSILLHINSDLCTSTILSLSQEMLQNEKVSFAVQIYLAVSSRNYVSFFKLVKSTTYLNACILHQYFAQVRAHAMRAIIRAFSRQKMKNIYPLYELQKQLLFDSVEDVLEFCRVSNVPVVEDSIILDKKVLKPIQMQEKMKRSYVGVECKRTCSVKEIVAGGPVPVDISIHHRVHNSFNADDVLKSQSWYAEDQGGFIENEEQLPQTEFRTSSFTFSSGSIPVLPSATTKSDIPPLQPVSTLPSVSRSSSIGQEQNHLKNTQVSSDGVTTKVNTGEDLNNFFKSANAPSKLDSNNTGWSIFHQPSPMSEGTGNIPSIFGGSSLPAKPSVLPPPLPTSEGEPPTSNANDVSKPEESAQMSIEETSKAGFTFSTPLIFQSVHATEQPAKQPVTTAAFSFSVPALPMPVTTSTTFKSPTDTLFGSDVSQKPSSTTQFWTSVVTSTAQTHNQASGNASALSVSQPLAKPDTGFQFVIDQKPSVFNQKSSVFDASRTQSTVFTSVPSSPPVTSSNQNSLFGTPSTISAFTSHSREFATSTPLVSTGSKTASTIQMSSVVVCCAPSTCSSTVFPVTESLFATPKSTSSVISSMFPSVTFSSALSSVSGVSPLRKGISSTKDTEMYVSDLKEISPKMTKLSESESSKSSSSSSSSTSFEEMDVEDDIPDGLVDVAKEEISSNTELPESISLQNQHSPPCSPKRPTVTETEATRHSNLKLLSRLFHQWKTFTNRSKLKRRIEIHDSTLLSGYEHRLSMPPGCEVVDHRTQLDYTIDAEEIGSESFRTQDDIRRIKIENILIDSLSMKDNIDSDVFWKLVVSLPDEAESGRKFCAHIHHWADTVFSDERENRRFQKESDILRMSYGKINGMDNVVTSVRRVVGQMKDPSDVKGVNGILFFTSRAIRDIDSCHMRFRQIVQSNAIQKALPLVIIVGASSWKGICREWLLNAVERKDIIEYKMIGPLDMWEESAMQKVEASIRWLAGHSKPVPSLAGFPLKELLINFIEDLWVRVQYTLASRCSSASQQHPEDMLELYHEMLKRLQKMLKNDCIDEFVDTAPEFEDVLKEKEFFEQNHMYKTLMPLWKEKNYTKKLNEAFLRTKISLRLPQEENLNLESYCEAFCISYPQLRGMVSQYICKWKMENENIDWVYVTKVLTELHISHVMENLGFSNLVGVFSKGEIFKFCTEPWYRSWLKDRLAGSECQGSLGEEEACTSLDNKSDDILEESELSELSEMSKIPDETDSSKEMLEKFGDLLDELETLNLETAEIQKKEECHDISEIEAKLNEFEEFLMLGKSNLHL